MRTVVDGGTTALDGSSAPPTAASPFTLQVVARVAGDTSRLHAWGDNAVLLDAALFAYVGRGDALRLLGDIASYAHDVTGDDLVAYGAGSPSFAYLERLRIADGMPVLLTRTETRTWDGARWNVGPATTVDSPPPAPEPEVVKDVDGTVVRLHGQEVEVDGTKEECELVPARDGHVYGTCREGKVQLIMRTPGGWGRVERLRATMLSSPVRLAVARDGAVWFHDKVTGLTRVMPDGRKGTMTLPDPDPSLARPMYLGSSPDLTVKAEGGARFWQSTVIKEPVVSTSIRSVQNLVPLADGSVWGLGYERSAGEGLVVFRYGPGQSAPFVIGTAFDQENEIRNAKPPRPWDGRCPQIFVSLDPAAHPKEVKAALLARKRRLSVDVIAGRLFDTKVTGVLLARAEPEAGQATLEAAAAPLLALEGAEAFCTAPVLERLLEPAQARE